ncbi:MAG: hypothetical protein KAW12_15695 [Candidatus Aminicenantes bacterium]|nr:hypothetical protein [Candidatus Aminicenantes bacterium]
MKNIIIILICLLFLVSVPLTGKMLIELGNEHEASLKMLKGEWFIRENGYVLKFSDRYARKLFGIKYYFYSPTRNPKNKVYLFTVVKSKKTGRLYFARGQYRNGEFYSSTSRIRFRGKNRIVVYSRDNDREPLYEAVRVVRKKPKTHSSGS